MKRNVKIIFSKLSLRVKCREMGILERRIPTECSTGKYDGFWLLWGVYKTKYYYGSVEKSKFPFIGHLHIDKKINDLKDDPKKKADSSFDIFQAA